MIYSLDSMIDKLMSQKLGKHVHRGMTTILLLCLALGCSDEDNPLGKEGDEFVYPLRLGNLWEYERTFDLFNFRPDTLEVPHFDTSISAIVRIHVLGSKTLPGDKKVLVLQESINEEGGVDTISESYYQNEDDGLYFYGYRGPGYVIPKASTRGRIYFAGQYFGHIREVTAFLEKAISISTASDTVIYEQPPLKSLPYPLEVGESWTYREAGQPFKIIKTVVGTDSVAVPWGTEECFKIQWQIHINTNVEFYDYVSALGLVRRHIIYRDLIITGEHGPQPIGRYDAEDLSQLTNFSQIR